MLMDPKAAPLISLPCWLLLYRIFQAIQWVMFKWLVVPQGYGMYIVVTYALSKFSR